VVSHREVVRDSAEFGLRRMVRAMAAILPLAALIQVLINRGDYRQPAVAAGTWLAVFAAGAWLVPRMRRDGLTLGEAAAGIMIAVVAVAVIGWEHRAHHPSESVDLAILGTVWLLALVASSQPARVWIPGALAVYGVHAGLLIGVAGANPQSLAQLEAAGYILGAVLIAFAALRPTVAMHTSMTARRAALASRAEAERAAAVAVLADRQGRLALLEMEVLPLLRGIADGTLDPAAGGVLQRCARHAADLRHSLTDHGLTDHGLTDHGLTDQGLADEGLAGHGLTDQGLAGRASDASGLLARLQPALRAARARGALVNVQVIGDPGIVQAQVADAVLATVDAVISALPPHQVMLTVLGSADDVEVYLTFSEPLRETPDLAPFGRDLPAAARWHAAVTGQEAGPGCLEISWRKAGPGDRPH
jgi:hypothetical protein